MHHLQIMYLLYYVTSSFHTLNMKTLLQKSRKLNNFRLEFVEVHFELQCIKSTAILQNNVSKDLFYKVSFYPLASIVTKKNVLYTAVNNLSVQCTTTNNMKIYSFLYTTLHTFPYKQMTFSFEFFFISP